jgi:hypothetical protein
MAEASSVCTSVCTPLDEATIHAAIDRLTVALTTAPDEDIRGIIAERRALREELDALQGREGDVVRVNLPRRRTGGDRPPDQGGLG